MLSFGVGRRTLLLSHVARQTEQVPDGSPPAQGRTASSPPMRGIVQDSGPYVRGWGLMDELPWGLSMMAGARPDEREIPFPSRWVLRSHL